MYVTVYTTGHLLLIRSLKSVTPTPALHLWPESSPLHLSRHRVTSGTQRYFPLPTSVASHSHSDMLPRSVGTFTSRQPRCSLSSQPCRDMCARWVHCSCWVSLTPPTRRRPSTRRPNGRHLAPSPAQEEPNLSHICFCSSGASCGTCTKQCPPRHSWRSA
jgi:hypothetical protein